MDIIDINNFAENQEEAQQEIVLRYIKLSSKDQNFLGLEDCPKIVEAGFVAICTSGWIEVLLGNKIYKVKSGQMCVSFPTTIQTIRKSNDCEILLLGANVGFLRNINIQSTSELFLAIRNNPCISLTDEEIRALPLYFEYIHMRYEQKEHPYRMNMVSLMMFLLCYEIAAIYQRVITTSKQNYTYKDTIFRNFMHLLSEKYLNERRISYYAQELCITPKYLSTIVKEVSQKSAAEWIDDFVMRDIKLLLTTTSMTIQQISDKLNFPNPSFFTQYFKRATGKTPKQFRNEM